MRRQDGTVVVISMSLSNTKLAELNDLIDKLDFDRAWLLEQIDRGRWPGFREDLASLERELSQLLHRASEMIQEEKANSN